MIGEGRFCPHCHRMTLMHLSHLYRVVDAKGNEIAPAYDTWRCICGYSEAGQNPAHCDIPYETSAFGFPNYYYYIRTYAFVNRQVP